MKHSDLRTGVDVCFLIDFRFSSVNAEYLHKRKLSLGLTATFDGEIIIGYPTMHFISASDSMATRYGQSLYSRSSQVCACVLSGRNGRDWGKKAKILLEFSDLVPGD